MWRGLGELKVTAKINWSGEVVDRLQQLLDKANGRRKARTLTLKRVQETAEQALVEQQRYSWSVGGWVDDVRQLTTLCLAVATEKTVTIGLKQVRANHCEPSWAWPELAPWDGYSGASNISRTQTWARREHPNALVIRLELPSALGSSEEELWQAVLQSPDDDAPRLVLADLLSEKSDPRGEFISVQCELARSNVNSPRVAQLKARERELLELHGAQWLDPVPLAGVQVQFKRGFLDSVTCNDTTEILAYPQFFERQVIRELRFLSVSGFDMHLFAAAGWLARLETLSFEGSGYGVDRFHAEHVHALLESRHLRQLKGLHFLGHQIDNMGALVLAKNAGAALPNLEALTLAHDELSEIGVQGLMATRFHTQLRELNLAHNQLRSGGVEALSLTRSPGQLRVLNLESNSMGDDGARALAAAPRLETLRELNVARNNIGPVGFEALLSSPFLKGLTQLEADGNSMGSRARALYERRFSH